MSAASTHINDFHANLTNNSIKLGNYTLGTQVDIKHVREILAILLLWLL